MAAENFKKAEEIFHNAIEIAEPAKRAAYLENACKRDYKLRAEVEALLRAHEKAGDFLEAPGLEPDATLEESAGIKGPGTKIGRYELLELIGEGGMGLVYLAEQQEPLRRRVALKIVKLGMDTKQVIARFEAERQALALLDHTNIAHVFDAGTTKAGRPYFVMEYVEGVSITKYCDEQKLNIEERLELFKQVCEGVQHAHQKGIIHRDIKPSNILVSNHGDKAVPKIIDFGIAKAITQPLTEETFFTHEGQLLGTPEYMSPEQVDLATQDIDTRSDIYSLGVLLYVLLAGVLPFDRESLEHAGFAELQRTIREEEPPLPSTRLTNLGKDAKVIAENRRTQIVTLTRRLHRELEWIPMKAMRKDRTRRYRSASELADDIQNYLTGTPLIAGPESTVYRARKFVRKHAGSVATAALVAVIIVLGLVASTALSFRAENARKQEATARTKAEQAEKIADKQRELAEKQRKLAEEQSKLAEEQRKIAEEQADKYRNLSYIHSVALADAKYREGTVRGTRQLLKSCPEDLRNWEWYRLNYVLDEAIITFGHDGKSAFAIAFSPDGKRIATGRMTITIWDAATGTEIRTLKGHEGPVYSAAFSPDGKWIVSGGGDHLVKVWDASNGEEVMNLEGHEVRISSIDLSTDGKRIVSGDYGGTIKVWDADSGEELLTIHAILGEGEYVRSVAISPDGKRIIAGRKSKRVHEWDAATGEKLRTFSAQDQSVLIVNYSPDGKRIAMGCGGGMIKIVDTETEKETILTEGKGWERSLVVSLAFSPDGKRLVSGGYDRIVRVWDTNTGKELTTLTGHPAPINHVVFSPDGQRIASTAYGGQSRIWDPSEDRESKVLKGGHTALVRDVVFTPDGKRLISASMDKTIKMWDVSKGEVIHTFSGHEDSIWSMAISPDGRHIVSGSGDNTVRIWDIDSGEQVRKITGHDGDVFSVVFSPDGKRIASAGKGVRVWDAKTGEEVMTLPMGGSAIAFSIAFSPDGRRIVSGSSRVVKIWDATTGKELRTLSGHKNTVRSISFTPNGKRIITGGYDATVRIWDAETGDELTVLYGNNRNVEAVAVSPDGKRIVSGSFLTAKVWDAETGAELMTLPSNEPLAVAFSPDGRTVAGSDGNDIILWESGPRAEVGGSE